MAKYILLANWTDQGVRSCRERHVDECSVCRLNWWSDFANPINRLIRKGEAPWHRCDREQDIHHPFVKRVRFEMPYARTTILSAQMETVLLYAVQTGGRPPGRIMSRPKWWAPRQ